MTKRENMIRKSKTAVSSASRPNKTGIIMDLEPQSEMAAAFLRDFDL